MSEEYISLYGETAEWFLETKELLEELERNGVKISNAEFVRRLLEDFDVDAADDVDDRASPRQAG